MTSLKILSKAVLMLVLCLNSALADRLKDITSIAGGEVKSDCRVWSCGWVARYR